MDVFVGNLPGTITVEILEKLLAPIERQVRIKLHPCVGQEGKAACYAVCSFSSERVARKAIKKFDGYTIFSRRLAVREFLHRSYNNERRALGWRDRPWHGVERRGSERRRGRTLAAQADPLFDATPEPASTTEEKSRVRILGYRDFATKHS